MIGRLVFRTGAIFAILFLLGFSFVAYGFARPLSRSPNDSQGAQTVAAIGNSLSFALVPVLYALGTNSFSEGGALVVVSGDQLQVTTSILGSPDTAFVDVLQTPEQNITLGTTTTGSSGAGSFRGGTALPPGTYQIGLLIFASDKVSAPVAVSSPRAFVVNLPPAADDLNSTSTASSTGSATSTPTRGSVSSISTTSASMNASAPVDEAPPANGNGGSAWTFGLVGVQTSNVSQGYRFSTAGTAVVRLSPGQSILKVELSFQDGNPSTAYRVALSLNGTIIDVGAMTTNRQGGVVLHSSIQVNQGRYLLGILVYDVSTFKTGSPVLVMVSDPKTQLVLITPSRSAGAPPFSASTPAQTASEGTTAWKTTNTGSEIETQIEDEKSSMAIPATVQVTPLSSSTTVLDSRFSISVGQQAGNGLIVAISGANVTGPRVLLINMSQTAPLALYPAFNVTLDGVPVVQASSALQVLNPAAGDPARYALIATPTSVQLLVSIPHFSLHFIQVAGAIVHTVQTALELDAPLLAGSVLVITLAFAAAYLTRKRAFGNLA